MNVANNKRNPSIPSGLRTCAAAAILLTVGFQSGWAAPDEPPKSLSAAGVAETNATMRLADYVKGQRPPRFNPNTKLPPLTIYWPYFDSLELATEMAERWDFCLEFRGYATAAAVRQMLAAGPQDRRAQGIALRQADAKRYPMQATLNREYVDGDGHSAEGLPAETWLHDDRGELVLGQKIWSPEASKVAIQKMVQARVNGLQSLREAGVSKLAVMLNGAEYGFAGSAGGQEAIGMLDPKVRAMRGSIPWDRYVQQAFVRQEQPIAGAARAAIPHGLYIYYGTSGRRDRGGRWSNDPGGYGPGFPYTMGITDLPSQELYYMAGWGSGGYGFGGGFIYGGAVSWDMLSERLNSVAQNIVYGKPLSYDWLSAGCSDTAIHSGFYNYEGFLKCLYASGMIGEVVQDYASELGCGWNPQRPDPKFAPGQEPKWIRFYLLSSRVHALFSHVDNFLFDGDLLPGNGRGAMSFDLPAYEFRTPNDPNFRVLVRKLRGEDEWLITTWLSLDTPDEVVTRKENLEIPGIGGITLAARTCGTVYRVKLAAGKPVMKQLDPDPDDPSAIPDTEYRPVVVEDLLKVAWDGKKPKLKLTGHLGMSLYENAGVAAGSITVGPGESAFAKSVSCFAVILDEPANTPFTVRYKVEPGPVKEGVDIETVAGEDVIPAGVKRWPIAMLTPIQNKRADGSRRLILKLLPDERYTIESASACVDVYDDDKPSVWVNGAGWKPGADWTRGVDAAVVRMFPPLEHDVTLALKVAGTAVPGKDYTLVTVAGSNPPQGRVTILAGDTSATITVVPVRDAERKDERTVVIGIDPDRNPGLDLSQNGQSVTIIIKQVGEKGGG
jgi:hypothetical protein